MLRRARLPAFLAFATIVTITTIATVIDAHAAATTDTLNATVQDPRAFGYRIGDPMHRDIVVHAPAGLRLDAESLPSAGTPGQPIELRQLHWSRVDEGQGSRYVIGLDYQVFVSPPDVRTFEMPPLVLNFVGTPRAQELRIEAWPITVSPLAPVEASVRRGLGDMQPDAPPPRLDTDAATRRIVACSAVAGVLALYLLGVYVGLPWWSRRHRPFDAAWRRLRSASSPADASPSDRYRNACREVHAALNRVAGEVLFARGLDRFVASRPAYASVRDDLARFFTRSQRAFFADEVGTEADRDAVVALCRRCRDIERGAA